MSFEAKIIKKDGKIYLNILCDSYYDSPKKERKRIYITEYEAKQILLEKGNEVAECISCSSNIDNKNDKLRAEFIFVNAKTESRRKSRKRNKNLKKEQKSLDNVEKDVIIKETNIEE
tara:strand:- start:87 stop:437 length:351 start_codon:yes stop_codon:yes gene_type:complete